MKKLFTSVICATMISSSGFAQACDTLFNLNSPLDTPTVYVADTGTNVGYLSGNNLYGDLAEAEGFRAIIGDSLYSAVFYFAVVTINSSDSDKPVTLAVWDNKDTSAYGIPGAPGNIIDTVSVTLRQIAQVVTDGINTQSLVGILVNFAPVAITTDTIYAGVILPQTLGDTVALFINILPGGGDGNGWEYEGDSVWGSYNDEYSIKKGSFGNYIQVEICGTATAVNTLADDVNMKVFPNPANDQLNFEWNLNDAAEIVMYDMAGKEVKSFTIMGTALNTFNIEDLAPGPYIIRVTDRQTNQQRSQLFTKM